MDFALLILGVGIMGLVFVLFNKDKKNSNKNKTNQEMKELEALIDKYFFELQEDNHKQHQAYLNDVGFLHKKVNTLEAKLKMLEKYKKIDMKIDSDSDDEIELMMYDTFETPNKQTKHELDIVDTENTHHNQPDVVKHNELNKQVTQLFNQGYTVEQIAKMLNIMCGEAQLIIGIYKKNQS